MLKSKYFKWLNFLLVLIILLVIISIISLSIGSAGIIFFHRLSETEKILLLKIRLPRLIMAFSVGGMLSLSGVILQALFRNVLVEPYTLGISGGAVLALSLNLSFGLNKIFGNFTLPLTSFSGAVFIIFILLALKRKNLKIESLLLKGVMISFICSSLFMLIMALSRTSNLQTIVYWMMGNLEQSESSLIIFAFICSISGLVLSYFFSIKLNVLYLGEEEAIYLGLNVEKLKRVLLLLCSFLTAIAVSVAGVIGFVGLVVPHFVRLIFGIDHRIVLPASFICGAIFLIFCDIIARSIIMPIELPVGVITGIIGGSLFVYALLKKEKL